VRIGAFAVGVATFGLLVSGCSEENPPPTDAIEYVAMGDSYAAAPGVPETTTDCARSSGNYAHVLAKSDPKLRLTDVTCSGASSADLIATQVPELSDDTDLVTIGIGGNDFDLATTALGGCSRLGLQDPDGSPCTDLVGDQLDVVMTKIQSEISQALDAVVDAAPNARVIVVGYPSLLPRSGGCTDRIPLAKGDLPLLREVNARLVAALQAPAEERGLDYVDLFAESQGHDICSDEPWINGIETAADGTTPFHPFAVEQEAIATMIAEML